MLADVDQWFRDYDPKSKIRDIVKNTNCRLTYQDTISYELLAAGGEDIKLALKRQMGAALGNMIVEKTRFTMTDDSHGMIKRVRASVYVFTEAELMKLVEDIHDAR